MNFRSAKRELPGIELTPLIDIIFQLVLFFMVSTTFDRSPAIDIDLPQASTKQLVTEDQSLEIWIDGKGDLFLNRVKSDKKSLESDITSNLSANPNLVVVIKADKSVEHRVVVELIDFLQVIGVSKVSIGTADDE